MCITFLKETHGIVVFLETSDSKTHLVHSCQTKNSTLLPLPYPAMIWVHVALFCYKATNIPVGSQQELFVWHSSIRYILHLMQPQALNGSASQFELSASCTWMNSLYLLHTSCSYVVVACMSLWVCGGAYFFRLVWETGIGFICLVVTNDHWEDSFTRNIQ